MKLIFTLVSRFREGFTFCLDTKSKQKSQGIIIPKCKTTQRSSRSTKLVYAVTQILKLEFRQLCLKHGFATLHLCLFYYLCIMMPFPRPTC